jgi:hypothetical protein
MLMPHTFSYSGIKDDRMGGASAGKESGSLNLLGRGYMSEKNTFVMLDHWVLELIVPAMSYL